MNIHGILVVQTLYNDRNDFVIKEEFIMEIQNSDTIKNYNKASIEKQDEYIVNALSEHYNLIKRDCSEFERFKVFNMDYSVKQYEVEGVGNLSIMDCKNSDSLQMISIVITPFYKNLPLMSCDFMYTGEKRTFLMEIYELIEEKDDKFDSYMKEFQAIKDDYDALNDMKVKECWYDDIRPVCTAKQILSDQDKEMIEIFERNIQLYIKMEQDMQKLPQEKLMGKWNATQLYTDKLIDVGGPATNAVKTVMGAEKCRTFFNGVFFGVGLYKPE